MKIRFRLPLLAPAIALLVASGAAADPLAFTGTHAIRFSHNGAIDEVSATGTGVAFVNESVGGSPLQSLELTRPFAEIDATVTAQPGAGVDEIRFEDVRINPFLAGPGGSPGLFEKIVTPTSSGVPGLTKNTLPAAGRIRICNVGGCPESVVVELEQTSGGVAFGPGVGGTFMVNGAGPSFLTIMAEPWTIKTTTVSYRTTINGGTGFITSMGFAEGPAGNASTASLTGGMIQLVSGIQTTSFGLQGSNDLSGQIARLRITFAPEPAMGLLLAAGAAGLATLGRHRKRSLRRRGASEGPDSESPDRQPNRKERDR